MKLMKLILSILLTICFISCESKPRKGSDVLIIHEVSRIESGYIYKIKTGEAFSGYITYFSTERLGYPEDTLIISKK